MQRASRRWVDAFLTRCVDLRCAADNKPFLHIAAAVGIEELLGEYVESKLYLPSGGGKVLEELLAVGSEVTLQYSDEVATDLASALPLTQVVKYVNTTFTGVSRHILRRALAAKRKDLTATDLLHLLRAIHASPNPHFSSSLDISRQLLKSRLTLPHAVNFLRLLCLLDIHRKDIINPLLKIIEKTTPTPISKVNPRQATAMWTVLSQLYMKKSCGGKLDKVGDVLLHLAETGGMYEVAEVPRVLVAVAGVVHAAHDGSVLKVKCMEYYSTLADKIHQRRPDVVTAADLVKIAQSAAAVKNKKLLSKVTEILTLGGVWGDLNNFGLVEIYKAGGEGGHLGVLRAVGHRLVVMEDPIRVRVTRRAALRMLEVTSKSTWTRAHPKECRGVADRLAEFISEAYIEGSKPSWEEVTSCLSCLAMLRAPHQVLVSEILSSLPDSSPPTSSHYATVIWSFAHLQVHPPESFLSRLPTAVSPAVRDTISWGFERLGLPPLPPPYVKEVVDGGGAPPIVPDTRIYLTNFV